MVATETGVQRRTFTCEEYHQMAEAGILSPEERLELIDGEIYVMPPIGDRHVETVNLFNETLMPLLAGRARVSIQNPVRLDWRNEPEPDIVVFRAGVRGAPRPESILLLIEVAESTLGMDRQTKLARYAFFGVPEYWIVNLLTEQIEVYREPEGDQYRVARRYGRGERLSLLAFPDVEFAVDDVLP